jgi:hypothetical protein
MVADPPPPSWPSHLISLLSPQPLPSNMRRDSTPQGRQVKPMYGPRNRDLVELWVDVVAPPPQVTSAAYISLLSPQPLPSIMRRDSTPQERQFKPMDVRRNRDLVELWIEMFAPPPPSWPALPTSPSFHPSLYRRLCGGIVHPKSVTLSLCTSFAIEIWWRYGWKWSLPPPR